MAKAKRPKSKGGGRTKKTEGKSARHKVSAKRTLSSSGKKLVSPGKSRPLRALAVPPRGFLRLSDLKVFQEIGKTITSTLDLKEVLKVIMENVHEIFNPRNWALMLMDQDTNELYFEVVVGTNLETMRKVRLKVGQGVAGWVAQHRRPLLIPDANRDARYDPAYNFILGFRAHSIICAPLISKQRILGVIELFNDRERGEFRDEDLFLLSTIADYAAIAIENATYFRQIQELTITDEVTGLYNTRFLYQALENEIRRSKRYGKHFTLVFIDLDHFKNVNDVHGHLAGSNLLKEVGQVFLSSLRDVDIITRYGGDEFVVILPETRKAEGLKATERIREVLNSHTFHPARGLEVKITASFGVASYPVDARSHIKLIRLADQAMYRVKETTRDGIAAASRSTYGADQSKAQTEIAHLRSSAHFGNK